MGWSCSIDSRTNSLLARGCLTPRPDPNPECTAHSTAATCSRFSLPDSYTRFCSRTVYVYLVKMLTERFYKSLWVPICTCTFFITLQYYWEKKHRVQVHVFHRWDFKSFCINTGSIRKYRTLDRKAKRTDRRRQTLALFFQCQFPAEINYIDFKVHFSGHKLWLCCQLNTNVDVWVESFYRICWAG